MKTRIFTKLLYALMATMLLTSCDEHFEEDFSWHSWMPGMVYSTNGDVTTYEKCIENGNTPEAVLFYVDASDEIPGIAYAVSLDASSQDAFSNPDTIYVAQGTSTDINACDGELNTTALRYGVQAKYFIPSVCEMYKLYAARHIVNATINRCGGVTLPVDSIDCWYWTSTECESAATDRAWCFSLYSGRFESTDKHTSLPVRPIMMIRLNKEEQIRK